MATKDEKKEQAQEQASAQEQAAPEMVEVILNPATELVAYTFEDGVGFNDGTRYSLTEEQMETYGRKTVSGKKLLIRA